MERHNCPLSEEDIVEVKKITNHKESLSIMQEDIRSLKADVKDIKQALIGDGFNPGFKQRIEKVEVDTKDNTNKISKIFTIAYVAKGIPGIIMILLVVPFFVYRIKHSTNLKKVHIDER